jgi:hypothetical protein
MSHFLYISRHRHGSTESRGPGEGLAIILRHAQHLRPGLVCLALGFGFGGIAVGCGGSTGSDTQTQAEQVPDYAVKMKNAMKQKAAAQKGRTGGMGRGQGKRPAGT